MEDRFFFEDAPGGTDPHREGAPLNGLSAQPYRRKRKEHPHASPRGPNSEPTPCRGLIGKGRHGPGLRGPRQHLRQHGGVEGASPRAACRRRLAVDRFNEEGLVGTRLKHPHVLSARELVENDGRIALVLDLVQGGQTIEKVVNRDFP